MIQKTFLSSAIAIAIAISASSALASPSTDSKTKAKPAVAVAPTSEVKKTTDVIKIYNPSDFDTNQLYEEKASKLIKNTSLLPNEQNDKVFVKVTGQSGAKAKVTVQPQNITIELKEVSPGNFEATVDDVNKEMIFNSTFHIELSSGSDFSRSVNSMILRDKNK